MAACIPSRHLFSDPVSASSRSRSHRHGAPDLASFPALKSFPSLFPRFSVPMLSHRRPFWTTTLRSEDLAEQIKEMAANEKRWQSQVRDGKVRAMSPKQAGYALQLSGHRLLDVRPATERNRAWVKDSVWIPLFDVEKGFDPATFLNRFSNFAMGGWWSGVPLMKLNKQFVAEVTHNIPRDGNVIVSCQKGMRSLAACEQLYNAGYRNLFWIEGGLDAAEEGDLAREGPMAFKFAGIGGMSEFLGWTDQQRIAGAKEGWGYRAVYFGRLVGIVLLVDALFLGAQELGKTFKH